MLPAGNQDWIPSAKSSQDVTYSEGLFTSYRSPHFKAAFPFGHGLSYTSFVYSSPHLVTHKCPARACVALAITNSGKRAGTEIAQAYLNFPHAEGMPQQMLHGFQKTKLLQPGEAEEVVFPLTDQDMSVYSPADQWVLQTIVNVRIGASSEDIRQEIVISV